MNRPLRIGIIGDFKGSNPSHLATNEAIQHAASMLSLAVECSWLPTPSLDCAPSGADGKQTLLTQFDGLWCSPGSPYQSMAGALKAIRFAREHDKPFIGT
jgi:CTP synthase (UTP-ammonia lyase)